MMNTRKLIKIAVYVDKQVVTLVSSALRRDFVYTKMG